MSGKGRRAYNRGREPMAREPHVALFKTVPGSLARIQILAAVFKALQNSEYIKKGLPKLPLLLSSVVL